MSHSMTDPSYADVAQWLPTDIREAIEVTMPCPRGDRHVWHHERTELHAMDRLEPVLVYEFWICTDCGVSTRTDPGELE